MYIYVYGSIYWLRRRIFVFTLSLGWCKRRNLVFALGLGCCVGVSLLWSGVGVVCIGPL